MLFFLSQKPTDSADKQAPALQFELGQNRNELALKHGNNQTRGLRSHDPKSSEVQALFYGAGWLSLEFRITLPIFLPTRCFHDLHGPFLFCVFPPLTA